jgi:hypothetical protein
MQSYARQRQGRTTRRRSPRQGRTGRRRSPRQGRQGRSTRRRSPRERRGGSGYSRMMTPSQQSSILNHYNARGLNYSG